MNDDLKNEWNPDRSSSIDKEGNREKIRIADVEGRFQSRKTKVFLILIFIYALIPFIQMNGNPIIWINLTERHFYLFGTTFNSQDFYLIFFLLTGLIFTLFFITALVGRIWCGWACPQTVFLEGIYRKIERWIEGDRSEQLRLAKSAWNSEKIKKVILKQFLFVLASLFIIHTFLSYFVSIPELFKMFREGPNQNWPIFLFVVISSALIHINFTWFREQLCLIVCPYGRLQSALTDDDSIIIGYDQSRDSCINCKRCIAVCPTGIDIREGLQMECIGCANCIDACDMIMDKIKQPRGLIRYDSLNGLKNKAKKLLRPRIFLYLALWILGASVSILVFQSRDSFDAVISRSSSSPFEIVNGKIINKYKIQIANKSHERTKFSILVNKKNSIGVILPFREISLKSFEIRYIPIILQVSKEEYQKLDKKFIEIKIKNLGSEEEQRFDLTLLGP